MEPDKEAAIKGTGHCRKGSPLEVTEGNTRITDEKEMMQRDANKHAPHWTTRQDKTNQQQTLQNKQRIIKLQLMPNSFLSKNTTVNDKLTAGRFDPKVFVNYVHVSCTQLTKTFGLKRPAVNLSLTVVFLLKKEFGISGSNQL